MKIDRYFDGLRVYGPDTVSQSHDIDTNWDKHIKLGLESNPASRI